MNAFCHCLIYLTVISIGSFFIGRLIPAKFCYLRFPYRSLRFEKNGELYIKIGIHKWQNKLPDMSKVCSELMPVKKLPKQLTAANVEQMLQETCVAELTHFILCILGMGCTYLWKGLGGWLLSVLYFLGNLPYILIQRYNRPRLLRLLERQLLKESVHEKETEEIETHEKGSYIKLQHRARA